MLEFATHGVGEIVAHISKDLNGSLAEDLHVSSDGSWYHEHFGTTSVKLATEQSV